MSETIAIDVDGVLCADGVFSGKITKNSDGDGYVGYKEYYLNAVPLKDAVQAVNLLFERGFTIILFSSRLEEDRKVTEDWLKRYGIKFNELILNKPQCRWYIDDRAIRFNGNWKEIVSSLL